MQYSTLDKNVAHELDRATQLCAQSYEEEGGIILKKGEENYLFVKLRNIYTGSNTALGLFEADAEDIKHEIIPLIADGWKMYASFHTHPSFSPTPSQLDIAKLFMGFTHNYIYATEREVYSVSDWMGEDCKDLHVTFISKAAVEALL